ncbi:unnamed protein product [Rangifer tarandus platyrhynchus]|uniref:Uncharacterized protein n=1 Tax=Rangifer tarandus platyrhynchus TaxID=3082113 RepID=A0AC59ZFR3_RANTA
MLGLQSLAGVSQGPGSRVRFNPKSFSEPSPLQGKSLCGVHGSPRRPQVFITVFLLLRMCTAEEIKELSKKEMKRSQGCDPVSAESGVGWCLHQQWHPLLNRAVKPCCLCLFCLGLKLESNSEPRPPDNQERSDRQLLPSSPRLLPLLFSEQLRASPALWSMILSSVS